MAARSWRSSGAIFDIEQREARARELEGKMAEPGFWEDPEKAQKVVADLKALRRIYEPYQELLRQVDDAEGMAALLAQVRPAWFAALGRRAGAGDVAAQMTEAGRSKR